MTTDLRHTPLFEIHRANGAEMAPFDGWEMPFRYANVASEVRVVRQSCGIFDLSHKAQFQIEGEGASAWLNEMVFTDWSEIAPGRAATALLLNENGGVIDEVMGCRLGAESWLLVANASRAEVDEMHLRAHLPAEIALESGYGHAALIAVQGATSQAILQKLIGESLDDVAWHDVILMGGTDAVLLHGGSIGCDGFEIMLNADDAAPLWNALLHAGATPCGLGALETVRIESARPAYGHELREDWTPDESGVASAAPINSAGIDFIGRAALLEKRAQQNADSKTILALKSRNETIPRVGNRVLDIDGAPLGEITSGAWSESVGAAIALASLPRSLRIGGEVRVEIDGVSHGAQIVEPPFVLRERE